MNQLENTIVSREVVKVELGERSYDIKIGRNLLDSDGQIITNLMEECRVAIVTDTNVANLHLAALQSLLDSANIQHTTIILPAGEATKSYQHLQQVCDAVLEARLERNDWIIALGGGVIGDLAGFAAGLVRRGMRFIQIPTSLLAQVDSSVGGKTGINSSHGKNLVGLFNQPSFVFADTAMLDTLPDRDFKAGYAEIAKYGLIDDPAFFEWLEKNWRGIFSGGPEREQAIAHSCRAKARVVAADEFENGCRALLNLGHTFGHALEKAADYDTALLVHGEGVSIGMVMAFSFSQSLELCSGEDTDRVKSHLAEVGLPVSVSQLPFQLPGVDYLLDIIAQDKKVSRGKLTFILARGIGKSFIQNDVPIEKVRQFLDKALKQ